MTGASGLVGRALTDSLRQDGVDVVPLVRDRRPGIRWDPAGGWIDAAALEGIPAVVHLAGENIAGGLWTAARRRRIRDSRAQGTALLAGALAGLRDRPTVLVSASAVGFYGDRGEEELTEASPPGSGFLPEVAVAWERSTAPAAAAGIRTVVLRSGIVLTPKGSLLRRVLPPFRLGLGGRLGSGRQWMSWITLPDLLAVQRLALSHPALAGPVNAVAPTPVRNADFTAQLGGALHRPTAFPIPASLLRLALGALAEEALLGSTRAVPRVLQEMRFRWSHPTLAAALDALL